jgi:hypothetical protein
MCAKKIGRSDIIGEQGMALIRTTVLQMGFMFYETGGVEAGIDGYVEVRDPTTGEVSNLILQVQGKATEQRFPGETDEGFFWPCEERDLQYWLYGTAPVLLVVARPSEGLAYWKSLKDYFSDPTAVRDRKVAFDKRKDAFTADAAEALKAVAASVSPGAVLPPPKRTERLVPNLVRVSSTGSRIYMAETGHPNNKTFGAALRALQLDAPGEWIVKGKRVISFHDLDAHPWSRLCDTGTVEDFDASEWSESNDPDMRRDFVQLLNRALKAKLWPDVGYDRDADCYYFRKPQDRDRLAVSYAGEGRTTSRQVVKLYTGKKGHRHYRHSAFEGRFLKVGGDWFLEVNPTYRFTSDGFREWLFAADWLKGIKEMENNGAVLGQFVMWRHHLTKSSGDLLRREYPFLAFEAVPDMTLDVGVPEDLWRAHEPPERGTLFVEEAE